MGLARLVDELLDSFENILSNIRVLSFGLATAAN